MNIYIQVVYTGNTKLPGGALNTTEQGFEDMPVRNPDGTTGIKLHIDEGPRLNKTVNYTGSNFPELKQTCYENSTKDRAGIYQLALIVSFDDEATRSKSGVAETPGRFLIIQNNPVSGDALVVHEILHNAVGVLPPDIDGRCENDQVHSCDGGYLYKGPVGGDPAFYTGEGDMRYLPLDIPEYIESNGFETNATSPTPRRAIK